MPASTHISLSELQALIKRGIDNAHPLPYWVTAEISELKVNYSGHCYIELVEKGGANHVPKAKASAVIWRSGYPMIASYFQGATGQILAAGLKVLVKVVVSYHELYGLSLQITDIDPTYTLGDMERQRQETIRRLRQDGVFDMNRELPLPAAIQRIAVISSRNAAGYQDFMKEISSSPYGFEITLFDAFMQGAEAEESIVRALGEAADRADGFDALVLIRGGGSQSDLGCFNSYRLCCYLAQFPLPVIAGIGHDKDQSVADLVAAVSLKTPTAVAVYLKNGMAEFDAGLDDMRKELKEAAQAFFLQRRSALRDAAFALNRISTQGTQAVRLRLEQLRGALRHGAAQAIRRREDRTAALQAQLRQSARFAFSDANFRLDNLLAMLRHRSREYVASRTKALSLLGDLAATRDPDRILDMGLAVVRSGGNIVTDPVGLQAGDSVEIVMKRRTIEAEIKKIK